PLREFVGAESEEVMLNKQLPRAPHLYNGLALAYVGDAVYELYVRKYLLDQGGTKAYVMHKQATNYVSAKAQAKIVNSWLRTSVLTEQELDMVKRGRNAKINTAPKHTDLSVYRLSSGFESLIGYLYLSEQMERMEELIALGFKTIEKE